MRPAPRPSWCWRPPRRFFAATLSRSEPHRCLGSHFASVELQVSYARMLARLPEFRLDPDNPPRFHGGPVIGIDTLPLLWDV